MHKSAGPFPEIERATSLFSIRSSKYLSWSSNSSNSGWDPFCQLYPLARLTMPDRCLFAYNIKFPADISYFPERSRYRRVRFNHLQFFLVWGDTKAFSVPAQHVNFVFSGWTWGNGFDFHWRILPGSPVLQIAIKDL